MPTLSHLNELEYTDANEQKVKVHLHDGRLYFQVRDDDTGDFDTPRSIQDKDILVIKNMYGGNGNDRNLCLKFGLKFADVRPHQLLSAVKQKLQKTLTAECADEDSVVTEMVPDSSAGGLNGLNIIVTISYNPNSEPSLKVGAAKNLLAKLLNPVALQALFTSSTLPAPFNTNVTLLDREDVTAKILHKNVPASIMKVLLTSTDTTTTVTLLPVGNWDHISIKYDTSSVKQSDNELIRLKDGATLTHTYNGVVVGTLTKLYVNLHDSDFKVLYSYENAVTSGTLAVDTAVRKSVTNNYY